MRKLPVAVVTSVIAHAAAIAWVVRDGDVLAVPLPAAPSPRSAPPSPPPPEQPIDAPIAVVFLDREPTPAASRAGDRPAVVPRRRAEVSTAAGGAPSVELRTGEPGPGRSPWMTMRGSEPARPALRGPSGSFLDDFLARSKPLAPAPDIPGERLANEIADLRARLRHASPGEAGALRAQLVELNRQRAAEELKPAGGGTYKTDKRTFTARVDADGTVHMNDKPSQLDRQDKLMLRYGIDPYARNKLAFLDRTRDQRVAVGERHRREQLGRSAELMQRNLERLWRVARGVADQKQGLFELWDDCAETGSDELVAGGAAARQLVIGAIRSRLRGPDAYTADELARLNAHRHSKAVFAPYAD